MNLLLVLLALTSLLSGARGDQPLKCEPGYTLAVNQREMTSSCVKCPDSCEACFMRDGDSSLLCTRCKPNHYIVATGQTDWYDFSKISKCEKCAEGCTECYGPKLSDCSKMDEGLLLVKKEDGFITEKCSEGCSFCADDKICLKCRSGYLSSWVRGDKGEPVKTEGIDQVTCSKCKVDGCMKCQTKGSSEICSSCSLNHGFNKDKSSCLPCSDAACGDCSKRNDQCLQCKAGHYLDLLTGACKKNPANCQRADQSGRCVVCDVGYSVDPTAKNCYKCSFLATFCTRCTALKGQASNFGCTRCLDGFFFDSIDKKACRPCPQNCKECSDANTCTSCLKKPNILLKSGHCEQGNYFNCMASDDKGNCYRCYPHFFSKDGQCSLCHKSCYSCDGPSEAECTSCPVDKFSYLSKKNGKTSTFCYDTCPATDSDGNKLLSLPVQRKCVKDTSKEEWKPTSIYNFKRSLDNGEVTLQTLADDARLFTMQLLDYISQISARSIERGNNDEGVREKYSRACNYNGKLFQVLSQNREAYLACKCNEYFHDPNCGTDEDLFNSVQDFVFRVIKDLSSLNYPDFNREVAQIYMDLSRGSLSEDNLIYLLNSFKSDFLVDKISCADTDNFLLMLDSLITANYLFSAEIDRNLDKSKFGSELAAYKSRTYRRLHELVDQFTGIAAKCMEATYMADIDSAATGAFQVIRKHHFKDLFTVKKELKIQPPSLLATRKEKMPIAFSIVSESLEKTLPSPYSVFGMAFSSLLFQEDKFSYASHVVMLDLLCDPTVGPKCFGESGTKLNSLDSIKITFPLRFEDVDENASKEASCLSIEYYDKDNTFFISKMSAAKFEDKTEIDGQMYAVCEYSKGSNFGADRFFAVGYEKPVMRTVNYLNKVWNYGGYGFVFPDYPRKSQSNLVVALTLALFFVATALMS